MPCPLFHRLLPLSAQQARRGASPALRFEDGEEGGPETPAPLPLRDWDLLAALLPPDSFTFSSFFFFLLHTFLGSGLYKAHPLKISLGSERFGGPMGRELTQKLPLSCGIYFIASAVLVNM